MRSRMTAFCLAIVMVCQLPTLPTLPVAGLLAAILCAFIFCWHHSKALALPAAFLFGLGWAVFDGQGRMHAVLPQVLEGVDFWVTGEVRGLPAVNGRAQQMDFWVQQSCFDVLPSDCIEPNELFSKRLILLNYYGDEVLKPGQRWRWRVRLNQPHGFANPGSFDYEAWLMMQGYAAKGYVRQTQFNQLLGNSDPWLDRVRFELRTQLQSTMVSLPNAGSLLALIMGERGEVSDDQLALYTATGTNHLIVISGLHVGFIALISFSIGNALARIWPSLLRRVPAQKVGALWAICGALAYSVLAGFALPTQRAVIMLLVFMGGQLLAREYPRSFSFWLAMSLVLLLNPMSPVGAGFWLSFSAVATLLFVFGAATRLQAYDESERQPFTTKLRQTWRAWIAPQWAVFIGLSVPLLLWTGQLSVFSPLANLVAIPLVSLLVVPTALLGAALLHFTPSLGFGLLWLADAFLTFLQGFLRELIALSGQSGLWQGAFTNSMSLVFAISCCVLLLLPRGWPGRGLAPILLLPVFWPLQSAIPGASVQLWVLDVGQGLAIVLRTAGHTVLYDTGPAFNGGFDAGSAVVLPFLRQQGIAHIDRLIISHGDNDHQGGLNSVLAGISVDRISVSTVPKGVATAELCRAGQSWHFDGVHFEFLMTSEEGQRGGNDGSCVLRVDTGVHSVLLPGDIERAGESALVQAFGGYLQSSIVIAPHHGSQSSSSTEFIEAVQPQAVVYSAAYRSQFGHPASQVAQRYAEQGVCAWSTALSGALLFELTDQENSGELLRPAQFRQIRPRFWQLEQNTRSKRLHGLHDVEC